MEYPTIQQYSEGKLLQLSGTSPIGRWFGQLFSKSQLCMREGDANSAGDNKREECRVVLNEIDYAFFSPADIKKRARSKVAYSEVQFSICTVQLYG